MALFGLRNRLSVRSTSEQSSSTGGFGFSRCKSNSDSFKCATLLYWFVSRNPTTPKAITEKNNATIRTLFTPA